MNTAEKIIFKIVRSRLGRLIPSKQYISINYRLLIGYFPNIDNPHTFNEKLQWLKLYGFKPEYTKMVDKYLVKDYVSSLIGEEYIIPTIAVWDDVDDIRFDQLPNQFVLKCTHDSGGLIICKDKSSLDVDSAKDKLKKSLARNYYWNGREYPYRDVKPRIIAEKYMQDDDSFELKDYKVLCFNGEPRLIEVFTGRYTKNFSCNIYTENWAPTPLHQSKYGLPRSTYEYEKPVFLEEMLSLSRKIAQDMPHVRVDWYYTNNRLYFGEITFFDASGFEEFEPNEWNLVLGDMISLPFD